MFFVYFCIFLCIFFITAFMHTSTSKKQTENRRDFPEIQAGALKTSKPIWKSHADSSCASLASIYRPPACLKRAPRIKKNTEKKNEQKKCVIGHGRGKTEADRAEIGTELMQKHSGGQKNRAEPCRNRPKYTKMYKKSQKNNKKMVLAPARRTLVGRPFTTRESILMVHSVHSVHFHCIFI